MANRCPWKHLLATATSVLAVMFCQPTNVHAAPLHAGSEHPSIFGTVNEVTGTFTSHGRMKFNHRVTGMAYDGNTDTLYALSNKWWEEDGRAVIYTVDPSVPSGMTTIGEYGMAGLSGLAFDNVNNVLWASEQPGKVYEIDTTTGEHVRAIDLPKRSDGLAHGGGKLWGMTENGSVYSIDTNTGTIDDLVELGDVDWNAMAYDADTRLLYASRMGEGRQNAHFAAINPVTGAFSELPNTAGGIYRLQSLAPTVGFGSGPGPGDANGDGVVDVADLGILGANFNMTDVVFSDGDFNGDNIVDVADLGILGANWSAAQAMTVLQALQSSELNPLVPEPAIATMMILGLTCLGYRRR